MPLTETIHVVETEFTDDGPVNVTRDGRRIPVLDIIAMKAVVIEAFGRTAWLRYGHEHREDGPAVIRDDGGTAWYRDGELHREDGPAVTCSSGAEEWWIDGRPHRDFGPAFMNEDATDGVELPDVPAWIIEEPAAVAWVDATRPDALQTTLGVTDGGKTVFPCLPAYPKNLRTSRDDQYSMLSLPRNTQSIRKTHTIML